MCGRGLETSPPLLVTARERVKLLRAGFKGKEIEKLYLLLNDLEVAGT
jgi:hypothetical protein